MSPNKIFRNKVHLTAYTLVELIVVMGIVGVLITLSLGGLVGLRESSRLNKNVQDYVSEARSFLSRARNNVYDKAEIDLLGTEASCSTIATTPFIPDAIGYYFNTSTKEPQTIKCAATSLSTQGNFCCTVVNDVDTFKQGDNNITYTADCDGVLFEYSTGQIYKFNPGSKGNVTVTPGASITINGVKEQCTVTLKNETVGYSKEILFDSDNNAIEVQK
jgi:type II secretory pathway pseudopilin PulG